MTLRGARPLPQPGRRPRLLLGETAGAAGAERALPLLPAHRSSPKLRTDLLPRECAPPWGAQSPSEERGPGETDGGLEKGVSVGAQGTTSACVSVLAPGRRWGRFSVVVRGAGGACLRGLCQRLKEGLGPGPASGSSRRREAAPRGRSCPQTLTLTPGEGTSHPEAHPSPERSASAAGTQAWLLSCIPGLSGRWAPDSGLYRLWGCRGRLPEL